MSAQIEIGTYDGITVGGEVRGSLSANLVSSSDGSTHAEVVEIRLNADGIAGTLRLTKAETDVFSLLLARLADDASETDDRNANGKDSRIAERLTEEGRSITRDELIRMLLDLPRKSEIDVQIGTEHVAITGVVPWGPKGWAALQCHRPDFLEVLEGWQLPADVHEQVVNGTR